MGFAPIIRSAVKILDRVTKDLQPSVLHLIWKSQADGGAGAAVYKTVSRFAIVDQRQRQVRTEAGELAVSTATITFITPVLISTKDLIQLPDGTQNPIINVAGLLDPVTGIGYVSEVFLG